MEEILTTVISGLIGGTIAIISSYFTVRAKNSANYDDSNLLEKIEELKQLAKNKATLNDIEEITKKSEISKKEVEEKFIKRIKSLEEEVKSSYLISNNRLTNYEKEVVNAITSMFSLYSEFHLKTTYFPNRISRLVKLTDQSWYNDYLLLRDKLLECLLFLSLILKDSKPRKIISEVMELVMNFSKNNHKILFEIEKAYDSFKDNIEGNGTYDNLIQNESIKELFEQFKNENDLLHGKLKPLNHELRNEMILILEKGVILNKPL